MQENRDLRELFAMVHGRSAVESQEIFKRIRACDDPLMVLHLVKQAQLLLSDSQKPMPKVSGLHQIEESSQGDSFETLPARPWSVAATDRIVPEMMTNLFLKRSILSRALEERLLQHIGNHELSP